MNYYNEIDPFAAQWIRNLIEADLIPPGDVDTRSIKEVMPDDLRGYIQCHFFAGIAGWSLALQLAGVDAAQPLWTGSCPCQPYSAAGKGEGDNDPRNLWPDFFRLIRECRPECVIGEQVENAIGHGWLDGVSADLEREGYAVGAIVLGAHSVGAPHIRQRLFWGGKRLADAERAEPRSGEQSIKGQTRSGRNRPAINGDVIRLGDSGVCERERKQVSKIEGQHLLDANGASGPDRLEHAAGDGRNEGWTESERGSAASGCELGGLGDTSDSRLPLSEQPELSGTQRDNEGRAIEQPGGSPTVRMGHANSSGGEQTNAKQQGWDSVPAMWSQFIVIPCRDDKARRISSQPGDEPLAYGIPRDLGQGESKLRKLAIRAARTNRVGRLKGYGNAICPQTAAEFAKAFMGSESC